MSKNDPEPGSSGPSWQVPQERQPETDAYHIWTSRPLLRSVYWKPVPAPSHDLVSSSYEVFVEQRAWCAMHEHVWQTPAATVGEFGIRHGLTRDMVEKLHLVKRVFGGEVVA